MNNPPNQPNPNEQPGGYQPQSGGYPQQPGGYQPPQQPGGYPQQPDGYPTQQLPQQPGGYPQQPGVYPAQQAPPSSSGRPKWLPLLLGGIALVVVACILIFGASFFLATNLTQPVVDAGDRYMNALKAGDYQQAYDLSASSLQTEAGDAAGLQTALLSLQPTTWSWSSRNLSNGVGDLQGTATFTDGQSNPVRLSLIEEGGGWKVQGVSLR